MGNVFYYYFLYYRQLSAVLCSVQTVGKTPGLEKEHVSPPVGDILTVSQFIF